MSDIRKKIQKQQQKKKKNNNKNEQYQYQQVEQKDDCKYIIVCGGCVSGLGKGITTSSIGYLFQSSKKITVVKIDPYLNIDAGTMNPYEHGECFVTDDGGEVDLDIGNYERYLDIRLSKDNNITTGKVFQRMFNKQQKHQTLQMLPDLSKQILEMIQEVQKQQQADLVLIEVGGTVGDIESRVFYESIREMIYGLGKQRVFLILLTLVPILSQSGEQKTKLTQQAITTLRTYGLQPDLIVARSTCSIEQSNLNKISIYSGLKKEKIINNPDLRTTLGVPIMLYNQNIMGLINEQFQSPQISESHQIHELQKYLILQHRLHQQEGLKIAMVGKYTEMRDTYMSVIKALQHSSVEAQQNVNIQMIEAQDIDDPNDHQWNTIKQSHGLIVPGGFGNRGNESIMKAIRYARENQIPFLGICFGFQLATIEYARNVFNMTQLTSQEFDINNSMDHKNYLISQMNELNNKQLGGTMRKGLKSTLILNQQTLAYQIYGKLRIEERHRHRYEVNPIYTDLMQQAQLKFTGIAEEDTRRNIILELDQQSGHPFYFATQYHPELLSRQFMASPPFLAFILACSGQLQTRLNQSKQKVLEYQYPWKNIELSESDNDMNQFINKYIRVNNDPIASKHFTL